MVKKKPFQSLDEFAELGYEEARTNPATRAAPNVNRALSYIFSTGGSKILKINK